MPPEKTNGSSSTGSHSLSYAPAECGKSKDRYRDILIYLRHHHRSVRNICVYDIQSLRYVTNLKYAAPSRARGNFSRVFATCPFSIVKKITENWPGESTIFLLSVSFFFFQIFAGLFRLAAHHALRLSSIFFYNPGIRIDRALISPCAYVSMRSSCRILLLLCHS